MTHKKERAIIVITVAIMMVIYLCMAFMLKFNVSPDEELRYKIPLYIYHYGSLPIGTDKRVMLPFGNYSYAYYPQLLGGILSAGFMKVMALFTTSRSALLFAARWTSVLFGVLAAIFTSMTVKKLKHSWLLGWFALILVGFLPQFIYLSAYVNNDIIAIAGVAMIIYSLVAAQSETWNFKHVLCFALGCTVDLLGYLNSTPFILMGAVYAIFVIVKQVQGNLITWKKALTLSLSAILIVMILVLPLFIRNYILYHDFTGVNAFAKAYHRWLSSGGHQTMAPYGHNSARMLFGSDWMTTTLHSSLGLFGYMSVKIKPMFYDFYVLFAYTSLQFLIFPNIGKKIKFKSLGFFNLLMLIAAILTIWLSAHRSVTTDFQPQGRYVLTILPILTVWMTTGFQKMTMYWKNLKLRPTIIVLSILYIIIGLVIISHYIFLNPALV